MKIFKHVCFICSTMFAFNSYAADFYVMPESFKFEESDNNPLVKVQEKGDEIVVRIPLEVSYEAVLEFLKSEYGESFFDLDINKINILPEHIDFISEFFSKANSAFISSNVETDINKMKIIVKFNKNYSISKIKEALMFPTSLGTIDAKVICAGNLQNDICGKALKRIPIINRFATFENEQKKIAIKDYTFLRSYISSLALFKYNSIDDNLSNYIRTNIWQNGNCTSLTSILDKEACLITYKLDNTGSIKNVFINLSKIIYNKQDIDYNMNYFVLNENILNIKNNNLSIDFEKIRTELNAKYRLESKGEIDEITIPFVNSIEENMTYYFNIPSNSIYWKNGQIEIAPNQNMYGNGFFSIKGFLGYYDIPAQPIINLSFSYNPISDSVTLNQLKVVNLTFKDKDGKENQDVSNYRKEIITMINGYFTEDDVKNRIITIIHDIIAELRNSNTGIVSTK